MRIRSIFVRNFRKLTEPLHITGLGDGMTVIAGDNEDGKSTLLAALRAALFLKHKITGAAVEELVPYGSKVRPELRLELEFAGRPYSLYKAFYQDPRAASIFTRASPPAGFSARRDSPAGERRSAAQRA